ncbi:MAG TPA: thioesterase domain-containing protein [Burkholderiaceae bacterium]|nr:thioesterase domain-containing protein [Burkholderiaceae bacterium]
MLHHQRKVIEGLVGPIEVALDWPQQLDGTPRTRVAFIGHPHPLYGGTLDNKVAATLARAIAGCGWLAVRPNFRGVGGTAGEHDEGVGETEDFLHVIDTVHAWSGLPVADAPRALAGFSFGSFIAAQTAAALAARGTAPSHLILVGAAAGKWPLPPAAVPPLVIHGELDETIALTAVFDWARPQDIPVIVMPGADHFFHRRLGILKKLVVDHLGHQPAAVARAVAA